MNTLIILFLVACAVAFSSATNGSISDSLFDDDVNDDDVTVFSNELIESEETLKERRRNPCYTKKCQRGEICELTEDKKAGKCVCVPDCSFYVRHDPRLKACSNGNNTYETSCHLDQDHCRCRHGLDSCSAWNASKITLEYYGECRDLPDCRENDAKQFPMRMKDWLFVVMESLDRHSKLNDYKDLLESAKHDSNHSMAVIWKFCDLDKDPQDRSITRRELQYMVRRLKSMEECLVPFLDTCDANDDRNIDLLEWGQCLGIDHDQITDKCHNISKQKKENTN